MTTGARTSTSLETCSSPDSQTPRTRRGESSTRGAYLCHVAAELSAVARYYDRAFAVRLAGVRQRHAFDLVECREKLSVDDVESLPDLRAERGQRTLIVVDLEDCQDTTSAALWARLLAKAGRETRVALISSRRTAVTAALGNPPPGWEPVRLRYVGYTSSRLLGLGPIVNRLLPAAPAVRRLAALKIALFRPVLPDECGYKPSLSIVIPARNERGNIAKAIRRLPNFGGAELEVLFVEGHSTDGTWEEIERVVDEHDRASATDAAPRGCQTQRLRLVALRQTGRGKADAVRLGFGAASCDLVTVLDADLTMPPERLVDFYDAYRRGRGDFINGDRLSLPMERGAMRPLNRLGNRFFAWSLSRVLDTHLADTLCGTKLFARHDWARFIAWRADFGVRDPFGDFDMLFPAAALALGCVNLPIRYAARTYGATNIQRFRDGARFLAMTLAGWWYLKAGRKP